MKTEGEARFVISWSCGMDPIIALTLKQALKVIEDNATVPRTRRPIGSHGDAGPFSFCQSNIRTRATVASTSKLHR
jgi:dTDP-4-amino-4,6-dideoxygalactose transaminase